RFQQSVQGISAAFAEQVGLGRHDGGGTCHALMLHLASMNLLRTVRGAAPSPGTPREGWGEGFLAAPGNPRSQKSPHPALSRSTGRGGSAAIIILSLTILSCDRSPTSSSNPATKPAAVVSKTAPSESPATTQVARGPSVMMIDNQRYEFPPALLQLRHRDQKLDAILLSDDPKDAISES